MTSENAPDLEIIVTWTLHSMMIPYYLILTVDKAATVLLKIMSVGRVIILQVLVVLAERSQKHAIKILSLCAVATAKPMIISVLRNKLELVFLTLEHARNEHINRGVSGLKI